MGSDEGQKNTARGLQKLMNRYEKRAEDILYDPNFNEAIMLLRTTWNSQYPDYRIDPRDNTALPFYPRMPPRLWRDLQTDFQRDPSQQEPTPARSASVGWKERVSVLENYYWPPEDFHPLLRYGGPISGEFIAACILHGPRALPEPLSKYFPTKVEAIWLMLEESSRRDSTISLRLHPDINEQDIRTSTKLFLEAIRQEQEEKTANARIDQLRHDGFSDNAIARRLGLPRTTVNEHPDKD